uniref:Uncharacterized protein n=1 Tax=Ciona intestinalis TaxID=7719 RepID=H2XQ85_CIOIN
MSSSSSVQVDLSLQSNSLLFGFHFPKSFCGKVVHAQDLTCKGVPPTSVSTFIDQ